MARVRGELLLTDITLPTPTLRPLFDVEAVLVMLVWCRVWVVLTTLLPVGVVLVCGCRYESVFVRCFGDV